MNILIITTHLNAGGVSRYVINLGKGLKNRRHKIWIVCSQGEWLSRVDMAGVICKTIPINTKSICSPKILFSFFSLLPLILKEKIQIIHANTRVTQFVSYLFYKFLHIPYISTFHGFYRNSFFRKLFKLAGVRTIAVSKAVKKHLSDDLKIKEENIRIVYNGVELNQFKSKNKEKSHYVFKKDDYLVGILGRISEEKGHFLAVDAVRELSLIHRNIYLLVSGKGKLEEKFKSYIKKTEFEEKVKFFEGKAEEFLDMVDLLIVPSRKEGFGYSIIEAFIKGVPVVGFNTGGIAEIIRHKESGFLFYDYTPAALKNAIEEVMLQKELREKIIETAYQKASFFSLERMAEETEKVYTEVLHNLDEP